MPRDACSVIPNWSHHTVQRGNNDQNVFSVAADRCAHFGSPHGSYVDSLVRVLGFSLTATDMHLVLAPPDESPLTARLRFEALNTRVKPRDSAGT